MAFPNYLYCTVTNKCPRCHEGKVFENDNPYNFHNGVKMNKYCPACGLKYERETGYFYGAMYVSYGLQTALFSLLYGLDVLWWNLPSAIILTICLVAVAGLFPVTFRWSRIMWIAFFTKYDKNFIKITQ